MSSDLYQIFYKQWILSNPMKNKKNCQKEANDYWNEAKKMFEGDPKGLEVYI